MAIERGELAAGLLGGALGAVVLGLVLQIGRSAVPAVGGLIGSRSLNAGSVVLLGTGLVFGVAYAGVVTRYVDRYISAVLGITTRSDTAKGLLLPLTRRFGMGLVVTTAMGLLYGLTLGVAVGWIVVPTFSPAVGFLDPVWLLGFLLFGLVLGGTYGAIVMD